MKKFIKSIVILGLFLIPCFSFAGLDGPTFIKEVEGGGCTSYTSNDYDFICIDNLNCGSNNLFFNWLGGNSAFYTSSNAGDEGMACGPYNTINYCVGSCKVQLYGYKATDYTSLQCQTEYNLIPISDVTANYCMINFDLIDPADCPSSGSGDIVFSNVYVDNVLYPGGADIYLNVNERLSYDIYYSSELMYVDIDFEGDEDYINGIVSINEYRPTSEDFTNVFVSGLTLIFPYIVITLFVLFIRKLIRKIFK